MNPGDLLNEKYRIERLLGEGGMGSVYLAENQDVGRKVALKVLKPELASDPETLARFRAEARAAAAIGHPGIVDVLDLGATPQGAPFLVMERLVGQTLRQRLVSPPPLSVEQGVELVLQVLEVLQAAHAAGVIHRDLKPDNLFLTSQPQGRIKILDFGISKFRDGPAAHLTQTGQVMGTPLYMSPEQARGSRDVGASTDVYSVGAILYEMLSGQPPYPGQSYSEILAKMLTEPLPPLGPLHPGLPPDLVAAVERMLAKDPGARFASAEESGAALRASLQAGGPSLPLPSFSISALELSKTAPSARRPAAPPPTPTPVAPAPVAAPPRRNRLVVGTVLAGLMLLALGFSAIVWVAMGSTFATRPVHQDLGIAPPPAPPNPGPTPNPAPSPTPGPAPRDRSASAAADPPTGRFNGFVDEDDVFYGPAPTPLPHARYQQGAVVSDRGGWWTLTFDGPPPCTFKLTHIGGSKFTIDPHQICQVVDRRNGTPLTMHTNVGEVSIQHRRLSLTLTGTVPAGGPTFVTFHSAFEGTPWP